jgi:hypothetical protein
MRIHPKVIWPIVRQSAVRFLEFFHWSDSPEAAPKGEDRWTGGATRLLILCLPQQLRNYGRCANLGRADTHIQTRDCEFVGYYISTDGANSKRKGA